MTAFPTGAVSRPKTYHYLFLYPLDEPGGPRFELHVNPDRDQSGDSARSTASLRLTDLEDLRKCLSTLGSNAWSHFLGEAGPGNPVFEAIPCAVENVIEFLGLNPPRPFDSLTLLALDSSIEEMSGRLEKWRSQSGQKARQA